jgi:DHA1 family bicyclomycin/chloramphenicol resistance-like MFS transporter
MLVTGSRRSSRRSSAPGAGVTTWRGIFVVLAVLSALIALARLAAPARDAAARAPHRPGLAATLRSCAAAARPLVRRSRAGRRLAFGALFAYISGSSFVLQGVYGVSPQLYSVLFAMNGLG